jgi:hypothetical protein
VLRSFVEELVPEREYANHTESADLLATRESHAPRECAPNYANQEEDATPTEDAESSATRD